MIRLLHRKNSRKGSNIWKN